MQSFLQQLLTQLHPQAVRELRSIEAEQRKDTQHLNMTKQRLHQQTTEAAVDAGGVAAAASVAPHLHSTSSAATASSVAVWDAAYYVGQMKAAAFELDERTLSQYFALQRCIEVPQLTHSLTTRRRRSSCLTLAVCVCVCAWQGIGLVFSRVFGCQVVQVPMAPGEDWTEVSGLHPRSLRWSATQPYSASLSLTERLLLPVQAWPGRHAQEVIKLEVTAQHTGEVSTTSSATPAAVALQTARPSCPSLLC